MAVPEASVARLLRGPAIRDHALRVLIGHERESLHYRESFDLLAGQGYAIAGKDPLAVFLTQITPLPAIKAAPRRGL